MNTHDVLAAVVARIKCKPGWSFRLVTPESDVFPKLVITVPGYDSAGASSTDRILYVAEEVDRLSKDCGRERGGFVPSQDFLSVLAAFHEAWGNHRRFTVSHWRPVPEAEYNEATWLEWVFEQCRSVENHELGEWFRYGAERPFLPLHGPGEDPYTVHRFRPEADARTTQDGSLREPYE